MNCCYWYNMKHLVLIKILIYLHFLEIIVGTRASKSTNHKQPLQIPETLLKLYIGKSP